MFAVIFQVHPHASAWEDYLGHAATLRPDLLGIDGFLDNERFGSRDRPGWLVSLSLWRDEKALVRWRTQVRHHLAQEAGRDHVFADYRLRVGEVVADSGADAPLPQQRFDETEAGPVRTLTLTEHPEEPPMNGALEAERFESITRPGAFLWLRGWPDLAAAQAGTAQAGTAQAAAAQGTTTQPGSTQPSTVPAGRTRIVRVIRDYGMIQRGEAPQYYPPPPGRP